MSKLHVPAPESNEDDDRFEVNLALVASLLACVIALVVIAQDRPGAADPDPKKSATDQPRDIYDELAEQRELARKIADLDESVEIDPLYAWLAV